MAKPPKDIAASVRQRLLNLARQEGQVFDVVLVAFGLERLVYRLRVVPSARDIQRMEDCIGWLAYLAPEDARIVWLRAEGVRWRQVCIRAGVVRSTAWRRWAASLLTIAKHLNAMEKSGRKASAPKRAADKNVVKPDETGSGTLL